MIQESSPLKPLAVQQEGVTAFWKEAELVSGSFAV